MLSYVSLGPLYDPRMCNEAVKKCPWTLIYISIWTVAPKMLEDLDNFEGLHGFFEQYDDYKQRIAQKAQIKEELIPIACYPFQYCYQCIPEDKKKDIEKLWNDK